MWAWYSGRAARDSTQKAALKLAMVTYILRELSKELMRQVKGTVTILLKTYEVPRSLKQRPEGLGYRE